MYEIRSDAGKNRLYVTLKGSLGIDELNAAGRMAAYETKNLKEGFSAICDISEFVPVSEEGRVVLQESAKKIIELGMGNIVVVAVPGNAQAAACQWQQASHSVGCAVVYAPTLTDAEVLLDRIKKE